MMHHDAPAVSLRDVTKRYGRTAALDQVTLDIPRRSVVGLLGRNGAGKSTLLRIAAGLALPTSGSARTLGVDVARLDEEALERIGVVHQHAQLLGWMRARQLLDYVGSFYPRWDAMLARRMMGDLELDPNARVDALSPGNLQKLALVLALGHHPELVLLDEPLSDLDPVARQAVLQLLLDRVADDGPTIVVSSHLLHDIEPVIDHVVCLDAGRVVADATLDDLRERHAEWIVTARSGRLPPAFAEPWILTATVEGHRARLVVRDAGSDAVATFAAVHDADVEPRPMNLERLFLLLTRRDRGEASAELAAR